MADSQTGQPQSNPPPAASDRNLMAALSYVWILSIVMLFVKKDDAYVKFHAKQGLVLFLISIVSSMLYVFPFIGWFLGWILWLAVVILMLVGFIQAIQGKEYKLPLVYAWSQMIKV